MTLLSEYSDLSIKNASDIEPTSDVINESSQDLSPKTPIQQFYSGKCIFVTGGTGFMGKVLIEKLLRTCSDIDTIYLLIRNKKGKNMYSRLDDLFEDAVFESLKEKMPKFRHKIVGITGDCVLPGLGINKDDHATLKRRVEIVFHVAATVRFDEKLSTSSNININGTNELISLAHDIDNLKAVVHVSTVYCNCISREVDETFYPPGMSVENIQKLIESVDENVLQDITPRVLGKWPNTYAFTKCIAEDCIKRYGHDLPIVIFRPAIVIATWKEPTPGWIDNVYGPTGVIVGCGAGLLRVLQADANKIADMVPVDLAVNGILSAAWDRATHDHENPPIYNFVSSRQNPCTWGDFLKWNMKYGYGLPSIKCIWYQTITIIPQYHNYLIIMLLYHLIPGLFMDAALMISGRSPKILKIYKKIHKFTGVIAYFSTQEWLFYDNNVKSLWSKLTLEDKNLFNFDITSFTWEKYFADSLVGIRKFLFKDDEKTIPAAIKRMNRFKYLHYTILTIFWSIMICLFYLFLTNYIFN